METSFNRDLSQSDKERDVHITTAHIQPADDTASRSTNRIRVRYMFRRRRFWQSKCAGDPTTNSIKLTMLQQLDAMDQQIVARIRNLLTEVQSTGQSQRLVGWASYEASHNV